MRTRARIRRYVREQVFDNGQVPGDDPLAQGLLDSLALEQLIAFVEETFGIEITDEETVLENFESLDALTRLVQSKRA